MHDWMGAAYPSDHPDTHAVSPKTDEALPAASWTAFATIIHADAGGEEASAGGSRPKVWPVG